MKYYREYLNMILKAILIIWVTLFLVLFLMLGFEKKEELVYFLFGEYPAQGDYMISFQKSEDGVSATVIYKQYILRNDILDTENMSIYEDEVDRLSYYIDQDIIYNEDKLREVLLVNGLADIIDEEAATEDEIKSQESARKNERGHWNTGKAAAAITGRKNDEISILDIINGLRLFSHSFLFFILKGLLAMLGFGSIAGIVNKIARRNNVDVIFAGEISSGKTTIFRRLEHPGIDEDELLNITSTKDKQIKKGSRIPIGKKDIYPYMQDNPGHHYADIFDGINKRFFCNPCRIVIYTIALFPKNCLDEGIHMSDQYRIGQVNKACLQLSTVLESKKIRTPDKVIIFVNKMDLLYETQLDFSQAGENHKGKKLLEDIDAFKELKELVRRKREVCVIYGSALKDWGIYKIRTEIMETVKRSN